ncbi:MAG: methyltransferase domain-containing protein [Acidimicrobiia bacterium]|nr:methyltransferase domain-containing protein [Acidimicrobiia bacterium]
MQPDEIRAQQRATWDRFSPGWQKWDELVMDMLRPVGESIVARIDPRDDASHLEVAAGTGEPGLTIAALAPRGRVVLSDLSLGMLEGASNAASRRGLENVEVREADASALPFDDASFDSVSCRFGFMFFPDIDAAAREFARVLRPGGVVSTAVWAEPASNAWATVPMGEIAKVVDLPAAAPDAPGLFRCAAPGFISALFEAAGLHVVAEDDVAVAARVAPPDRFWEYMSEVAAPVVAGLSMTDDAGRERIRSATLAAMTEYEVDGHLVAPGLARVTTARKP